MWHDYQLIFHSTDDYEKALAAIKPAVTHASPKRKQLTTFNRSVPWLRHRLSGAGVTAFDVDEA